VLFISTKYCKAISPGTFFPFLEVHAEPTGDLYWPYLYLMLIVVVLLGSSNAVNLTDGLDRLAISVTFIAMTRLTAFTYLSSDKRGRRIWS
jgi:phospho-N-acetylmuramoyl-pentapeptide-transferase